MRTNIKQSGICISGEQNSLTIQLNHFNELNLTGIEKKDTVIPQNRAEASIIKNKTVTD